MPACVLPGGVWREEATAPGATVDVAGQGSSASEIAQVLGKYTWVELCSVQGHPREMLGGQLGSRLWSLARSLAGRERAGLGEGAPG